MKPVFVFFFIINCIFSQALDPTALLINTFYNSKSAMYGHAHTTFENTPMNAYFNPAGLALIDRQQIQIDASKYLNTKEFPNSETLYPVSINSIAFAAPSSSNKNAFILGFSLRAPLMNSYEYQFNNGIGDSFYNESYQYMQLGLSYAQKMSDNVYFGLTYSTYSGKTSIEERTAGNFNRKRKDEITITRSPDAFLFGLIYKPDSYVTLGLTLQSTSQMRIKDSRENEEKATIVKINPITKLGINYKLTSITDLYLDYHFVDRNNENGYQSLNAGFNLDIFEDLGFGIGFIAFDNFKVDEFVYTSGISFKNEDYEIVASIEYSRDDKRPFYFNHTESSRYLVQSSLIYFF